MKILNKIVNIVLILIIFICIYNISEKLIEYNKADNSYEKTKRIYPLFLTIFSKPLEHILNILESKKALTLSYLIELTIAGK